MTGLGIIIRGRMRVKAENRAEPIARNTWYIDAIRQARGL